MRIADHLAFDGWPDVAPLLAPLDGHERDAVSLDAPWCGTVQTLVVPRALIATRARARAAANALPPSRDVAMERALEQAGSAEVGPSGDRFIRTR